MSQEKFDVQIVWVLHVSHVAEKLFVLKIEVCHILLHRILALCYIDLLVEDSHLRASIPYEYFPTLSFLNSIKLHVRVPVLSEKT